MAVFVPSGVGWQRDLPDYRDYSPGHPLVEDMLRPLRRSRAADWRRVTSVDLREFFPGIRDQQHIDSSAAFACVSLVEYFERRAHGKISPLSAMYAYKGARKLQGASGDTGTNVRDVIRAIVRFGVPPEHSWPYDAENFDAEPDPFLHSYALEYRPIVYVRLDQRNAKGPKTLQIVKAFVAAGFPVVFGFSVPESLTSDSDIPYRPALDSSHGGQAVIAVGYDDQRIRTSKGALLVRSSWGSTWGDLGYGWLPYAYVEQQLAADFWTILRQDWLESGEFHQPRLLHRRPKAGTRQPGAGESMPPR